MGLSMQWQACRMQRWMEVPLSGVGCPGLRAGCLGSGSVDELEELCVERSNPGQNSEEFVDGNWGKGGGKLHLPTTHEIREPNPTKLHHTNKSQKKLGLFWGNFRIRNKINKTRLENKERGLRNRYQRGS